MSDIVTLVPVSTPLAQAVAHLRRRHRRRVLRRTLMALPVSLGVCLGATWYLVHSTSWAGPLLADGLRSLVGPEAVARVQEAVYGLEDQYYLATRSAESPQARWEVPALPRSAEVHPTVAPAATFQPLDVGPMDSKQAAPGDGVWVPVSLPNGGSAPLLFKTLLHPDPKRAWSEVFVAAIDLARTDLHLVSGTVEPKAVTPAGRRYALGQGRIPEAHRGLAIAGFNGGFKAEHGHYGMMVDSVQLLPPRPRSCTVLKQRDGRLRVGTWSELAPPEGSSSSLWWRQAPACMATGGELHQDLRDENRAWGAAVGGDTVIRRSGLGLSRDGKTLLVALGNHTTSLALARAMTHAGAHDVTQLDVNWAHTRFVVFEPAGDGQRVARSLFEGFVSEPDLYLNEPYTRDFFYLTRR